MTSAESDEGGCALEGSKGRIAEDRASNCSKVGGT